MVTDVSGQYIGPIFKGHPSGWDGLSLNVGNQLPTYAAQHPRTAETTTTMLRKPEISKERRNNAIGNINGVNNIGLFSNLG